MEFRMDQEPENEFPADDQLLPNSQNSLIRAIDRQTCIYVNSNELPLQPLPHGTLPSRDPEQTNPKSGGSGKSEACPVNFAFWPNSPRHLSASNWFLLVPLLSIPCSMFFSFFFFFFFILLSPQSSKSSGTRFTELG